MLQNVFFDTNILLDVLMDRAPFAEHSSAAWTLVEHGHCHGMVSAVTITTLYYLLRKHAGSAPALAALREILSRFTVLPTDQATLQRALTLKVADFEDAVQYATAEAGKAQIILSRNPRHFPKNRIPVMAPSVYLAQRG